MSAARRLDPPSHLQLVDLPPKRQDVLSISDGGVDRFMSRVDSQGSSENQKLKDANEIIASIEALHDASEALKYKATTLLYTFHSNKMWELYDDCANFPEFVKLHLKNNIGTSTAYAYVQIGALLDEFPFDSVSYTAEFAERFGYDFTPVEENGQVDANKTLESQGFLFGKDQEKIPFTRMKKIAAAMASEKISAASVPELINQAILLDQDGFDVELRKLTGSKVDADEALRDHGLLGGIYTMFNTSFPDRAQNEMEIRMREMKDGRDIPLEVFEEGSAAEHIATKSVKFFALPDGTVVFQMHLAD